MHKHVKNSEKGLTNISKHGKCEDFEYNLMTFQNTYDLYSRIKGSKTGVRQR